MIICAAVKFHIIPNHQDVVIPCLRHNYAYEIIRDLGFKPLDFNRLEEGFIDNKNNFLNREEAYKHAVDCGQLCSNTRYYNKDGRLYSEDLY